MAVTYRFPLSVLNNIFGVSGVNDIVLEIPEPIDIAQEVIDELIDSDDLIDVIANGVQDGLDIAFPIAELVSDFTTVLDGRLDDLQTDIGDDVRDIVIDVLADEVLDITGIKLDPDEIADDITDQLEDPVDPGSLVSFESVFGALSQDVAAGLQAALDETIGNLDDLPDDIDTIIDSLQGLADDIDEIEVPDIDDALAGFLDDLLDAFEDLPGGDLLFDPDAFLDAQLLRITNGLVSDEAVTGLQNTIDEVT